MDPKILLLRMTERLYEDIKFVTEQNPTQIVDDDGARAYNSLLNKAHRYFELGEFVEDFPEWQARTIKYKDALIVAGQLHAMVVALMESEGIAVAPLSAVRAHAATPAPAAVVPMPPPQPVATAPRPAAKPLTAPPLQNKGAEQPRAEEMPEESMDSSLDEELYGRPARPLLRNEDGTIPFSLD